jgi:hypothetical protein
MRASQLFCGTGVDAQYIKRHLETKAFGDNQLMVREQLVVLSDARWAGSQVHVGHSWEQVVRLAGHVGFGDVVGSALQVWLPLLREPEITIDQNRLDVQSWGSILGIVPDKGLLAVALTAFLRLRASGSDDADPVREALSSRGPDWAFIPAFRELRRAPEGGLGNRDSGEGLVAELHKWQSPDTARHGHEADQQRFRRLTALVQDVLDDPNARLHVPHDARTLQVATSQGPRHPIDIDELGDGIKQVVMIGAAALRHERTLVCLEEPEIHLHASLQRKLMRHLAATANQFLIATHSAHLLDTPGAAVLHVTHDGTGIRVSEATRVDDVAAIADDLGYRPADLMLTAYVIWVEGPADRIYYRRWLFLADPSLIDGVHYTLVSYGGSLLNDVTFENNPLLESVDTSPTVEDPEQAIRAMKPTQNAASSPRYGPPQRRPHTHRFLSLSRSGPSRTCCRL